MVRESPPEEVIAELKSESEEIQRARGRETDRGRTSGNETRSGATVPAGLGRSLRQQGRERGCGVRGDAPPPAGRSTPPLGREEAPARLPGRVGRWEGPRCPRSIPQRGTQAGGQVAERGLCPQRPDSLYEASPSTSLASFLTVVAGPL